MIRYLVWIPLILIQFSCSKNDSTVTEPDYTATGFIRGKIDNVNWFADKIEAHKQASTIYITGTQNFDAGSPYSNSLIDFRIINLSQPVTAGIGEDEPGYVYFVKANYTLKFADGSDDKVYTAYYRDYSTMDITRITDKALEATFFFIAYSEDFTDSVDVTNGAIKIDF
jgi:hypothetical protein